ncbi:LysR family transcriptional regulator [Paraburkholderia piptadeniae]|uniref:LysR family transcriptional regulator n=2 Tax=Paraburkholderia piptadeniae TaxID=1701573 RepID=A0A1N7SB08_9BURK|nr:LysR family transcriptional regulator [Paraburkholderia piptadeniae]
MSKVWFTCMAKHPASAVPSVSVLTRLRFRHLQLLDILGRTRNLRIAAEQMHITQPAATKILGDTETILGARLFERLPREMRPTELGMFALRYAGAAVADLGKFVNELDALRMGGHGHLTVGAISASAAGVVAEAMRDILRKRPLLRIRLVEQSSDQLVVWLEERKIDVMVGRLTEPHHQALFDFEKLSLEPVWVVCGKRHPLLDHARPEVADLAGWPWILYPPATAIRHLFEETMAAAGIRSLVGMVETPSIFSALALLQTTDMLSLQPRAAVEKYVDEGLLGQLDVPIRRTMPHYGIVTRKNEPLSEPMQEFISILRSVAEKSHA